MVDGGHYGMVGGCPASASGVIVILAQANTNLTVGKIVPNSYIFNPQYQLINQSTLIKYSPLGFHEEEKTLVSTIYISERVQIPSYGNILQGTFSGQVNNLS